MGWLTGIAVFFVVWWIALFMVLPWGNVPDREVQIGNAEGAPARPRMLLKAAVTTVLAGIIWLIIWFVVRFQVIAL